MSVIGPAEHRTAPADGGAARGRAGDDWSELESLLAKARRRPERLGADGVMRLGLLYRAAAAELARSRGPGGIARGAATRRLENLVARARIVIYDSQPRPRTLREYALRGYWGEVRDLVRPILIAWALMLAGAVLAYAWAVRDPGNAITLLPSQFRSGGGSPAPIGPNLGLATSAALSSQIFTNNIRVTLLAFAGGIFAGVVTAALLIYNGAILGVVLGLSADSGRLGLAVELVTPHGVLELSCIAVTSAAGARIGWSLIEPGPRSRLDALVRAARSSIGVVLLTAPWLVLAGLTEGFITPRRIGVVPAIVLGCGLAGLYWALVLTMGRGHRRPSPAAAPATSPGAAD